MLTADGKLAKALSNAVGSPKAIVFRDVYRTECQVGANRGATNTEATSARSELVFDTALHLVSSAREGLHQHPIYGSFQMVETEPCMPYRVAGDSIRRVINQTVGEQQFTLVADRREFDRLFAEFADEPSARTGARRREVN